MLKLKKFPFEIIKNHIKLKLKEYKVHENLLYINNRIYIFDVPEIRIRIIKNIHDFSSEDYANRLSIYDKIFVYYY